MNIYTTIIIAMVGVLATLSIHLNKLSNKRIDDVVKEFRNQRDHYGRENISALGFSGINMLKNDREFTLAFKKIKGFIGHHPLLQWKEETEKFGYKKFFTWVSENELSLTKDNIDKLLSDYMKKS